MTAVAEKKRSMTKTELVAKIAEAFGAEFPRKDAAKFLATLEAIAKAELWGRGKPGVFTIPGIAKLTKTRKPARKAKEGRNPATGEMMTFAAKPAHDVVRASVPKGIRESPEG